MEGRVEPRSAQRRRRRWALGTICVVAVVAALATLVFLRSSNDAPKTIVTPKASTTTAAPGDPNVSYIAQALPAKVPVFDDPSSPAPSNGFDNPWFVNNDPNAAVPLVFLQVGGKPGWVQVLLPIRPNGSKGWVHASDVKLVPTKYRIDVVLGSHQLTVYNDNEVVLQDTVAVGADQTPTPVGLFFIRALLKAPNPHTVYGPYAYGLSGFSDVLQEFSGGDAEVGIHGNNDESVLGQNVTHGCIRMSNDGVTQLANLLPLGVPVTVSS